MLVIDHVTFRIGRRVLLDNASATINQGQHVGLIGQNGSGKTTLLKIIQGVLEPETGEVSIVDGARIGITSQEAPSGDTPIIEFVLKFDRELISLQREAEEIADPYRIAEIHDRLRQIDASTAKARAAKILSGLGFPEANQTQTCQSLSGGWRMRVALAGLLFSAPEILLLDEPTNHLDFEATIWLTDFLKAYPGTVLVVSHDRELLNNVTTGIIHLENCDLTFYTGNFDRFDAARRQRLNQIEAVRRKQDIQKERILKFVERFRYKATKAKQAQSRLKLLEKMEPLPEISGNETRLFDFPEPKPIPPPLFNFDRVAAGYGEKEILKNLSLRIDSEDRIALLGANGNGKSTFLKILSGTLSARKGIVSKSRKLKVGYFSQHQAEELDLSATPFLELFRRKSAYPEERLRSHLARFGFSQERAETAVGLLSGGERARLLFALMSAEAPNVLLLDEPTNHLDMDSRDALIQAINNFPGAVIIVSHDPYVINMVADRLWLVENGSITPFDGALDEYRAQILRSRKIESESFNKKSSRALGRKEIRRDQAEQRLLMAPIRKQLKETEREIEILTERKECIARELADPELYKGRNASIAVLQKEHFDLGRKLSDAENEWLRLSDLLESPA